MLLRSLIILVLLAGAARGADVAMVDDELGQALLFQNRGLCYAVLPNHVSRDKDRIALVSPTPTTTGTAEIFWRDPQNDIALAYVEGSLSDQCALEYADLSRDLSDTLLNTETGLIKSVHFDGAFFDRIGATLIDVDDIFVTTKVSQAGVDAEVMQGLSGAMLSVGGTISGIAIDATDAGTARFMRIDRVVELIGVKLIGSSHPRTQTIAQPASGHGFRVTGFEGGEKAGVIALEPTDLANPWISAWSGEPIDFEITLSNTEVVALNKITMRTTATSTETPARNIAIQIDRGLPGNPFWRPLASPDMSPTGVFETATGGTWARRVKITIMDVWHPERNLRIDQLTLE